MNMNPVDKWAEDQRKIIDDTVTELRGTAERIADTIDGVDVSVVVWPAVMPFLMVSCDLQSSEKMNDVAVRLLRKLAALGHRIADKDDPYSDYPEIGRRTWKLTGKVTLALFVRTTDDGAACRYVKVGTKQEDQYELVCDDSPNASPTV